MIRKIAISLGTLLVVGVLSLFVVGSAYAQAPTPPEPGTPFANAWGRICDRGGVLSEVLSDLLGMSCEEISAERSEGKTLSEIGAEKGVADEQLIDAILTYRTEALNQAVADGRITQERADLRLEKMKSVVEQQIDRPFGLGGLREKLGGRFGQRGAGGLLRGPCTETTP